jgi:antitoxin VapB
MALNLKNTEVELLAAEVASMAGESKTEAIRQSLQDRKAKLLSISNPQTRSDRAESILTAFRASLSKPLSKVPLTRQEEDEILGFGPDGV